ncbi:MAG: alpha/beta hydrolase [Gammaproteobacteria bacterium]
MRKLPRRKEARIRGPAGELEALVELPAEAEPTGFGVACHPHPLHGGTMENKVVHTLCRSFTELGRAAVRFNFRGAGTSEGVYDEGRGETDDALAAVAWARDQFGGDAWLAGFSFGAAVALHAAAREAPARLITVAPPVGRLPVATETQPDCPWLIVQGADDELVDADAVVAWVNELAPGPELLLLPGVDHFFHGKLTVLREQLLDWLRSGGADQD